MNIIAKTTAITLTYFPNSLKKLLRSLLPLKIKRALGKNVMKNAVINKSVITVLDGRKFKTIEDRLFLRVFFDKDYEPSLSAIAKQLIFKDDYVVDVGANFGWYSTLFSQLATPGKVISYEPSPHSFAILDDNILLNKMESNIEVRKMGVGEVSGSYLMETGDISESGLAHVVNDKSNSTIEIPITTLDEDLSDKVSKISYLKIDIEGFELSALKGANKILNAPNQPIIQIELNEEALSRAGSSRIETISYLRDLGYSFYEVIPNNLGKLKESDATDCSDMFCVGKGIFSKRIDNLLIS